jgi:hypothetical protein
MSVLVRFRIRVRVSFRIRVADEYHIAGTTYPHFFGNWLRR